MSRALPFMLATLFFTIRPSDGYKSKGSTIIFAGMGRPGGGGGYGDDGYGEMNEMPVVITTGKKGKIAYIEDMLMSSMKKRKKKRKKMKPKMEEEDAEFDENYGYTPVRKECMVVCRKRQPQPEIPADMEWDAEDPY